MFTTSIMGFARLRRVSTRTTCRIIIRTIHGTVTMAARIITASQPRMGRLLAARTQSNSNVTFQTRTFAPLSIGDMNMETTNSMLVRVSRFFSDRYAYRTQPGYLSELVAFGMIVFIAGWPIVLVAHAMAAAPR